MTLTNKDAATIRRYRNNPWSEPVRSPKEAERMVEEIKVAWAHPAVPITQRDTPPVSDPVVRPHHYVRFEIDPATFIMRNKLPFAIGNVIKYVCRYDAKNGIEDLRKAIRYIEMQINLLEGKEEL